MRLPDWLRPRAALSAELETLRAENARLRYDLATAVIASWIRRAATPPQAAAPPESAPRPEPHPVRLGRHAQAEPVTEIYPRARGRR